jgi:hypothetical protein
VWILTGIWQALLLVLGSSAVLSVVWMRCRQLVAGHCRMDLLKAARLLCQLALLVRGISVSLLVPCLVLVAEVDSLLEWT